LTGVEAKVKRAARRSVAAAEPVRQRPVLNRQFFTTTMGPGVTEIYFRLDSPGGVYSRFEYAGCKAVLPKGYTQNIVAFVEGPSEMAPIVLQPLGPFNANPSPGVNLMEGNYFAGGGPINVRIFGPMGGSTSPIPTNRITVRRSAGDLSAAVTCFVAGYQE
jgi:hypothetical protein